VLTNETLPVPFGYVVYSLPRHPLVTTVEQGLIVLVVVPDVLYYKQCLLNLTTEIIILSI